MLQFKEIRRTFVLRIFSMDLDSAKALIVVICDFSTDTD